MGLAVADVVGAALGLADVVTLGVGVAVKTRDVEDDGVDVTEEGPDRVIVALGVEVCEADEI